MSQSTKGMAPIPEPKLECGCIPKATKQQIELLARANLERWLDKMVGTDFKSMLKSDRPKEAGHNFSGNAESRIRKGIAEFFTVRPSSKDRSSADFFVTVNNREYPFNSKLMICDRQPSGEWKFGRPNLVSLNRLFFPVVCEKSMDHYLVMYASVWVELDGSYEVRTHLVDILAYPQLVAADAGTGQCMTKAKDLYYCSDPPVVERDLQEDHIMALRSNTSVSHLKLRTYQTMIDHLEIALSRLRRRKVLPNVSTQLLRRRRNFDDANHPEWDKLKDLEGSHKLSTLFDREEDQSLFLQYVG